jgi:ubiquinone/menaquinone biosynthesis C-methylase UbiE
MLHIINNPVKMLNEIARVLQFNGLFFITDLRRSILGLFEKEINSAFTGKETKKILARSNLPKGTFSSDAIWWRYKTR